MKKVFFALCIIACTLTASAQPQNVAPAGTAADRQPSIYVGPGFGFDYGGIGGRIEYMPVKQAAIFAGLGYNLLSMGWNIGGTYRILPDARVCPTLKAMYGYNAVLRVFNASQYDMTSYGVSFGAGIDCKVGSRGSKLSFGILLPLRSKEFKDRYNDVKNNSNFTMINELWPIGISAGYNFKIK